LAIRDNPHDPYGKLLILAGESTNDLLIAARALVTRNNYAAHADAVFVSEVAIPARRQYDAPRWLQTDRPAAIGTYTTIQHLELRGSGSINIYFRLPPDLFLPARESVPLLLKYTYAGVGEGSKAALHIRLNDKHIDSIALAPAASRVEHSEVVRVPTGRLQRYINTLTVDFDFARQPHQSSARQYGAIGGDSSLDLGGLPHSVVLPRLELFADAGYPYSAWPDLGRTAVILPPSPSPADYEALLSMAGFFGAQTGYPTTGLAVIEPGQISTVTGKD